MTDEERQYALRELLEAREQQRLDDLWNALLAGDQVAVRRLQPRQRKK